MTVVEWMPIELAFPTFPDPVDDDGNAIPKLLPLDRTGERLYTVTLSGSGDVISTETLFDDYVMLPLWYWRKIVDYAIYVDETERIYEVYKKYDPG